MAENVKVAVRVRPFNSREKTRNATLIIDMHGNTTSIKDPAEPNSKPREFSFDYSYWSHDCFNERSDGYLVPTEPKYADQEKVFEDLGRGVLDNAWKGYNCSLFAYGQTGSGKSYSIVGYGPNKGIVPVFCEELFKGIDTAKGKGTGKEEYQVMVSMLEIYNEQVRDLLNKSTIGKKGGMKVREHPSKGFYVEGLKTVPVSSYVDIDARIEEGTKNRTVAATNMNATSSRAHTIVSITFVQKAPNEAGQSMTKTSGVYLVDLAGSERADSTGATGDRLKEGSAINQSLSSLGNVIKALADQSTGKKGVIVPFRDSVLTRLLKNALGGNSKTIMIAALSPADINYEETLSTLRFADRAKSIKTKAVINESPTDKLIRELREENQKLMDQLKNFHMNGGLPADAASGGPVQIGMSEEEVDEMKRALLEEQMKKNEEELEQMKKSWQEQLRETEAANKAKEEEERKQKEMRKTTPHFFNLNEDPQLSALVVHFVKEGKNKIGKKGEPSPDIVLNGLSILAEHAVIENRNNKTIMIHPMEKAKTKVNGKLLTDDEQELHHNDRVLFGSSHLYVFHHPTELEAAKAAGKEIEQVTYDMAQEEIAQKQGFELDHHDHSKESMLLNEDLCTLVPLVNEVQAISDELNKKRRFDIELISPQARGLKHGRTEVKVKMTNLENGNSWSWDRNKFINRKYIMQDMYQNYAEGEDWDREPDNDPFWEAVDVEQHIGSVHVYLQSLAYMIEVEEVLAITDNKGAEQGHLTLKILPCDQNGELLEDDFVEEPTEQIGRNLNVNVVISNAVGIPAQFSKGGTFCKYKMYLDENYISTPWCTSSTPQYNFSHQHTFSPVTHQLLKYFMNEVMVIEVWGKQTDDGSQQKKKSSVQAYNQANAKYNKELEYEKYKTMALLNTERRRNEKMEKRMKRVQKLVDDAVKANMTSIQVSELQEALRTDGSMFKAAAQVIVQTNQASKRAGDGQVTSRACSIQ